MKRVVEKSRVEGGRKKSKEIRGGLKGIEKFPLFSQTVFKAVSCSLSRNFAEISAYKFCVIFSVKFCRNSDEINLYFANSFGFCFSDISLRRNLLIREALLMTTGYLFETGFPSSLLYYNSTSCTRRPPGRVWPAQAPIKG